MNSFFPNPIDQAKFEPRSVSRQCPPSVFTCFSGGGLSSSIEATSAACLKNMAALQQQQMMNNGWLRFQSSMPVQPKKHPDKPALQTQFKVMVLSKTPFYGDPCK